MNSDEIKEWLGLIPNDEEGGYFASTYNSSIQLDNASLPGFAKINGTRSLCGGIYYFLDQGTFSAMHQVTGDMIYHFYSGDPVQMLILYPDDHPNTSEVCMFSNDLSSGGLPMKVIPGGAWLGSRLVTGGEYALMGVTMAPGFDPADYTIGDRDKLIKQYPDSEALITDLTRVK